MKKLHIFAPRRHSEERVCSSKKMASHSFVTRHCEAVQRHDHSSIGYIYAADGTKLRTIHRPASSSTLIDSTDYIGNLILKNGQPSMYLFDGGYASFNSNGAINGWHYYIQDYMGNNRMVVNQNGTTEQITHYYPYGGVIGDISTNESVQKYKFEGKELDRTFGLDNYDIHARQYFAMMPMWDRIDPLAEKYYGISPYAYCGGDPVNYADKEGLFLEGVDGKPVTYLEDTWSHNASSSLIKVCNSMMKSDIGRKLVHDMMETNYPISVDIIYGYGKDENGNNDVRKAGATDITYKTTTDGKNKIVRAEIELYMPVMEDIVACAGTNTSFPDKSQEGRYKNNSQSGVSLDLVIGGEGVHEATHATDERANIILYPEDRDKKLREVEPIKNQIEHIKTYH